MDTRLERIASLGEPVRRALYRFVAGQPSPVSRDEAAAGVGVPRHTAKFHLDKLVADGLLEVEYQRPPGRRGPGAGRPAKLYRRAAGEVSVSLPARRYELAGRLLAQAVTDARDRGIPVADAIHRVARATGTTLGRQARSTLGPRPTQKALTAAGCSVMADLGYEPRLEGTDVRLVNCPFHALAGEYTDLVCTMNLDFLSGLVEGLEHRAMEAQLDPEPGMCCVRLRAGRRSGGQQ